MLLHLVIGVIGLQCSTKLLHILASLSYILLFTEAKDNIPGGLKTDFSVCDGLCF